MESLVQCPYNPVRLDVGLLCSKCAPDTVLAEGVDQGDTVELCLDKAQDYYLDHAHLVLV